jgi:hypothetical protein
MRISFFEMLTAMVPMSFVFGCSLLIGFASGCAVSKAQIKIDSALDSNFVSRSYSKILVVMDGGQIGPQKRMESALIEALSTKYPVFTFEGAHKVLFPPIEKDELYSYARNNGFEGILLVGVVDANLSKGSTSTYGTAVGAYSDDSYSYSASSYTRKLLSIGYVGQFFDVRRPKPIWTCQASTIVSTGSEIDSLESSLATAVVAELGKTTLIGNSEVASNEHASIVKLDSKHLDRHAKRPLHDGFRRMRWFEPVHEEMEFLDDEGMFKGYFFKDELMTVWGQEADVVGYHFKDEKFVRMHIIWGFSKRLTLEQKNLLLKNLKKELGQPSKVVTELDSYRWNLGENLTVLLSNSNYVKMLKKKEGYLMDLVILRSDAQ